MKRVMLAVLAAGTIALGGCTNANDETVKSAATGAAIGGAVGAGAGAVIPGVSPVEGALAGAAVGAIAGTIAADKDGDGRADGYYRDGVYYPYEAAPPAPAPAVASRSGERG
jgi:hypothetical protein